METNRKGTLTEYQSSDHTRKEGKKKTDVSYLFSDDYDETKTPIHYTKKRSAWTFCYFASGGLLYKQQSVFFIPHKQTGGREQTVYEAEI